MPKTTASTATKLPSLTGVFMITFRPPAGSRRGDGVAGLVNRGFDALEGDLVVTDHDQLTALEIDPNVGDATDGADLLGDRTHTVLAGHAGDDVFDGDGHLEFLCAWGKG